MFQFLNSKSAKIEKTLREAALNKQYGIRRDVWNVLGNLGGDDAIGILADAYREESSHIYRLEIIRMLGRTGSSGYPGAVPILDRLYRDTTDGAEHNEIIGAMGSIKHGESVAALRGIYIDHHPVLARSLSEHLE